jgi:hypothetical protein
LGFQVSGGDLEAVEEEAGAAEVDFVGGDADEDLAERSLDVGAVGGGGHVEGVAAGLTLVGVGYGFATLMVVVAEGFSA